jgi:hypothetical protein
MSVLLFHGPKARRESLSADAFAVAASGQLVALQGPERRHAVATPIGQWRLFWYDLDGQSLGDVSFESAAPLTARFEDGQGRLLYEEETPWDIRLPSLDERRCGFYVGGDPCCHASVEVGQSLWQGDGRSAFADGNLLVIAERDYLIDHSFQPRPRLRLSPLAS